MSVVWASAHEVVVLKPRGLACELPRNSAADSLLQRVRAEHATGARLVHRLDAPSSGLVLVALSAGAAAHHSAEIAARRWEKWYVARVGLTAGAAQRLVGTHKAYLKNDGREARVVRAGGKVSLLEVAHCARAPGATDACHVLVRLHTGRLHQIRVMLAHLGAPLVGDARYGGRAAASMYLEHVVLRARPMGETHARSWAAPPHRDRDTWSDELAAAVLEAGRVTPV